MLNMSNYNNHKFNNKTNQKIFINKMNIIKKKTHQHRINCYNNNIKIKCKQKKNCSRKTKIENSIRKI